MRRGAVAPYFSKRRIMDFQPVIREKLDLLMSKLTMYENSDRVLNIERAFTALAGDVVTEFCFAKAYDHLNSPDFTETFHEAMAGAWCVYNGLSGSGSPMADGYKQIINISRAVPPAMANTQ